MTSCTSTRVARHYDARGTDALPSGAADPVVNMGLWSARGSAAPPRTLAEASEALFDLVLDEAQITPGARILDAGCGFGVAIQRALHRGAGSAVGLNLSSVQLSVARRRLGARAPVELLAASATAMPLPDASIDVVISVEAAFHFDTRDAFFHEALRVLRPGGRLVVADLVLTPPSTGLERLAMGALSGALAFPMSNVYDREEYALRIQRAGLRLASHRSLREHVVPQFRAWMLRSALAHRSLAVDLPAAPFLAYPWDYAIFAAQKPRSE